MITAPFELTGRWPGILSVRPVRIVQDIAGVSPLLFFNVTPRFWPIQEIYLLELLLTMSAIYIVASFTLLAVNSHRPLERKRQRAARAMLFSMAILAVLVAHNVVTRNWGEWFGGSPPVAFSEVAFVFEAILFLVVPLALVYLVIAEREDARSQAR